MTPLASIPEATDILPFVRKFAEKQREIYEAGRLAFVSFVRAYREHQVSKAWQVGVFPFYS